jgi:pilus assembly protein FimV
MNKLISFSSEYTTKITLLLLFIFVNINISYALTVGPAKVLSKQNQPLKATATLLNVKKGDIKTLKVRVAKSADMRKVGIKPVAFLQNIKFKITTNKQRKPIILMYSTKPVTAKFITFLLDVRWSSGRLLKQYSLLFVPAKKIPKKIHNTTMPTKRPVLSNKKNAGKRTITRSKRTGRFEMVDQFGPTVRGDTLWEVSVQIQKGVADTNQMMMAIYKYNKESFLGRNINRLKKGAILRIPDNKSATMNLSKRQALRLVQKHNKLYRDYVNSIRGITSQNQTVKIDNQENNVEPTENENKIESEDGKEKPKPEDTAEKELKNTTRAPVVDKKELELLKPDDATTAETTASGEGEEETQAKIEKQIATEEETLESHKSEKEGLTKDIEKLEQMEQQTQKLLDIKEKDLKNLQNTEIQNEDNVGNKASEQIKKIKDDPSYENILSSQLVWIFLVALFFIVLVVVILIKNRKKQLAAQESSEYDFDNFVDDVPDMPTLNDNDPSHSLDSEIDDNTDESKDAEIVEMLKEMKDDEKEDDSFTDIYQDDKEDELDDVFDTKNKDVYDAPSANRDEINTMLELAKTYIDIKDYENARQTLEEVLEEGDKSQKQLAQNLLDSIS